MGNVLRNAYVRDLDEAVGRALKGAAYLDGRLGSEWEGRIDLERLDIGGVFDCVLGQLNLQGSALMPSLRQGIEGGFSSGLAADLLAVLGRRSSAARRSYDLLTAAWRMLITARLEKAKGGLAPDQARTIRAGQTARADGMLTS